MGGCRSLRLLLSSYVVPLVRGRRMVSCAKKLSTFFSPSCLFRSALVVYLVSAVQAPQGRAAPLPAPTLHRTTLLFTAALLAATAATRRSIPSRIARMR